ncbi:adenylylsulfate kinase [Burkholderia sp. OK233]|nr:adenylylsulfate kinase [Burkholderia sp. OK233]
MMHNSQSVDVLQNIKAVPSHVGQRDRADLLRQEPVTIWFTGLSASGKSTLAYALERELVTCGHPCYVLDGDNVRHRLNRDLGFSEEDRTENIRRVAEVAALMNDAGLIVITALISPKRADREMACEIVGRDRFLEVYLSTPLLECEGRDPKGLYAKARDGRIQAFTGVSAPYEPPHASELVLDTAQTGLEACVTHMVSLVLSKTTNRQTCLP